MPEGRESLVNLVLLVARLGSTVGACVLSHFEHTLWETWAEGHPSSPASYTLVCVGKLGFSKLLNFGCEMFWLRGPVNAHGEEVPGPQGGDLQG